MRRIVSIWLSHWPIERLMRQKAASATPHLKALKTKPFALVGTQTQKLVLTAINTPAQQSSLYEGQNLADARAICPKLITAPAAPDDDAKTLLALARWAERFSPLRSIDAPDGLFLDVTGIGHLFGSEQALLDAIAAAFARLGLTAHLALAGTMGAAWALARYAPGKSLTVPAIPDGEIKSAIATLPIDGLRLDTAAAQLLQRLGLKRIGQLYDLPRASLERRFRSGKTAEAVLRRLDQALGRREERFTPLRSEPRQESRLAFPDPLISADGIAGALQHLAQSLCEGLARAHLGARRVHLKLYRTDSSASIAAAGFSTPCRDAAHLCRLLGEKLKTLDLGFGIDLMRLHALHCEPLGPAQAAWDSTAGRPETAPLIDRLANRLGARAVYRLVPQQSHLPERTQSARMAFAASPPWPKEVLRTLLSKPVRPALFLRRPEPLAVMAEIPESPPARFTWRRKTYRVMKAEGPERIAPEWWRCSPFQSTNTRSSRPEADSAPKRPRDYYRIEDEDGRRYWIFRDGLYQTQGEDGPPTWYLQGLFG